MAMGIDPARRHQAAACVDHLAAIQRLGQGDDAAILDAGFGVSKDERVIFSAKTGAGMADLLTALDRYLNIS